jgi:hypothetical protein
MKQHWSRRQVLKNAAAVSATRALPGVVTAARILFRDPPPEREIQIVSISENTVRLSVLPVRDGKPVATSFDGSLVRPSWGEPIARVKPSSPAQESKSGLLSIYVSPSPMAFRISNNHGDQIQQLEIDAPSGTVSFATGNSPVLGLGEGGPQFDRRGSTDPMVSGQGGYRLRTHGGRVPIPWMISTAGWAMFFHQPFGMFDFAGPQSKFHPSDPNAALDIFFVHSPEPAVIYSSKDDLVNYFRRLPSTIRQIPRGLFSLSSSGRALSGNP